MWIAAVSIIVYLELYQIGLFFLLKDTTEKPSFAIFVPIYGLKYMTKASGTFKILNVPLQKPFGFFAELLIVALLCSLYWNWGIANLVEKAYTWLGQIMIIPIVVCLALCYIAIAKSAINVFKTTSGIRRAGVVLLSVLIAPVPFMFAAKGLKK